MEAPWWSSGLFTLVGVALGFVLEEYRRRRAEARSAGEYWRSERAARYSAFLGEYSEAMWVLQTFVSEVRETPEEQASRQDLANRARRHVNAAREALNAMHLVASPEVAAAGKEGLLRLAIVASTDGVENATGHRFEGDVLDGMYHEAKVRRTQFIMAMRRDLGIPDDEPA